MKKKRSTKRRERKEEGEEDSLEVGEGGGDCGPHSQENQTSEPRPENDPPSETPEPRPSDPPEGGPVLKMKKDAPKPELKRPKPLGYSGRGRPPSGVGMTRRLREVLGMKAYNVEITREYCRIAELDDKQATVLDCLVHSQIHQALTGSAAHLAQIFDRVEGRVPIQADMTLEGKMSITDAVKMLDLGTESQILDADYETDEEETT